jgi:hypothetical protein
LRRRDDETRSAKAHELDELRVGNGAVDVPVPLGDSPVEVLATEQDLERPPATDDVRQTGRVGDLARGEKERRREQGKSTGRK